VKKLLCCLAATLLTGTAMADQWGVVGNRVYNYDKGTNYYRQGNRIIGSDGTVITKLQSNVFQKGKVIYRRNGDVYYGSNGVQWRKQGQFWLSNDGRQCRIARPLSDCDAL
jgi:hypothetical protein